ncbi:MAG TPA: tetratricopeptide repeat protein [Vicinamibacterales bacterium]|nr:tetratricopeptide repeat protein [Vicinamibacterales bacterium]
MNCTGTVLLLALLSVVPSTALAQAAAECPTLDCGSTGRTTLPAFNRLWAEAAATHKLKLEFVDALQRFTRAQAGTFGDEGPELRASATAMRESLERWDRAVQQFQAEAKRLTPAAEAHVAIATVLLNRYRAEDALRELKAAERDDDGRGDLYALQALAYGVLDRRQDAVRALRRAVALNPDNPALFYTLAQQSTQLEQPADASRARRDFQRAVVRQTDAAKGPPAASARFERIDLLRQVAGIAPIFPQARYVDAYVALNTGDYATAVTRFSEASVDDPLVAGDLAAHERVGRAAPMIRAGRLDDALKELQGAVTSWPNESEVHRLLGLAYWLNDQQGQSIDHLRSAIRLTPDDERARVTLAEVLAGDRRLAEAERELTQAVERGSRSGRIHHQIAQLYERQSLLPQAARSFEESENFGPIVGRDQFYLSLGSLRVNQADFDGAVAAYTRRIEANPNSGEAHRQLGEIYFLQGKNEEALTEFLAATWLDPRDAKAHAAAGQVQVRLLNYAEAVVALQRALSLDASLQEARYALGTSLMRLGKTADARRELEVFERQRTETELIGQHAFGLDAVRREASRSLLAGAFDQAIASYERALTLDPNGARSHRDLGLALLRAKRPQEAIAHLAAAQKLEATAEGYAYLADAYNATGDREESARQRALAVQLARGARLERIRELAR